eukprot:gene5569-11210_t
MTHSILSLFLLFGFVQANVRNLVDDDFSFVVDGSTNVLVEFYAPWCGHCKSLQPEWEVAASTFSPEDDIILAAVDATVAKKTGSKFKIEGYPTIKFFPKGSTTPEDYTGSRNAESIVKWINDKIGTKRKIKKEPTAVVDLTASNFDSIAFDPTKNVLVEFYAPWCGHCKALAPIYERVAAIFEGEKNVVLAKVDATDETDLAQRFDVSGYPTIKFFPATVTSDPELLEADYNVKSMVDFLNERSGTFRTEQGGLTEGAGRVKPLDDILEAAEIIDENVIEQLKKTAESIKDSKTFIKLYISIADKILDKGIEYVEKEIKRLASMIVSSNVHPEKKTGFLYRINVLKAFKKA